VAVVAKYPKVFPEELNSLSPDTVIEFLIHTFPKTTPFSKTSYRMAPTKLKRPKNQLQELLEKGFIRPSTSP